MARSRLGRTTTAPKALIRDLVTTIIHGTN